MLTEADGEVMQDVTSLLELSSGLSAFSASQGPSMGPVFPARLMAEGVLETVPEARTPEKYKFIAEAVTALVDKLPSTCNNQACPQGEFTGCVLRMAGHDFMDWDGSSGGADGCVDFADPDNNGLQPCLWSGEGNVSLNDAWDNDAIKHEVSLADFIVIAAEAVMYRQRGAIQPALNLSAKFTWGRVTALECGQNARLPNPDESCAANDKTFIQNMNLTWRQTAALMGVHTLGRARKENSGFSGWWSDPNNSAVFNNNYFHSLALKGWAPEVVSFQGKSKTQWKRVGETSGRFHEMMLNTDMCLLYANTDNSDLDSNGRQCCAWIMPAAYDTREERAQAMVNNAESETWCAHDVNVNSCAKMNWWNECASPRTVRRWCCEGEDGPSCNNLVRPGGMAADDVLEFARDESAWLSVFEDAWVEATKPRI